MWYLTRVLWASCIRGARRRAWMRTAGEHAIVRELMRRGRPLWGATRPPLLDALSSLHCCKAIVLRNVGNFANGDTWQRNACAFPLFVFRSRRFLRPRKKYEERIFLFVIAARRTPEARPLFRPVPILWGAEDWNVNITKSKSIF